MNYFMYVAMCVCLGRSNGVSQSIFIIPNIGIVLHTSCIFVLLL